MDSHWGQLFHKVVVRNKTQWPRTPLSNYNALFENKWFHKVTWFEKDSVSSKLFVYVWCECVCVYVRFFFLNKRAYFVITGKVKQENREKIYINAHKYLLVFLKGDSRVQYRARNKGPGSYEMSVGRNVQTHDSAWFLVIRVMKWPSDGNKGQWPGTSRVLGCDIVSKTNKSLKT